MKTSAMGVGEVVDEDGGGGGANTGALPRLCCARYAEGGNLGAMLVCAG